MEISAFYNIAKEYSKMIKEGDAELAKNADAQVCLILTGTKEMLSGVTGSRIIKDTFEKVSAAENAISYLSLSGKNKAEQIAVLKLADDSVVPVTEAELQLLYKVSRDNAKTQVLISDSEQKAASDIAAPEKDDLGAPAEFVSGFDFDESNPFFEEASDEPSVAHPNTAAPKFLNDQPGTKPEQPAAAAPQQQAPQGFPQQQGYPGQPMGQGFPQQQAYPGQPMGGYQQQAYPGQPMQQGYPGQPMQQGYPGQPQNFQQGGGFTARPGVLPSPTAYQPGQTRSTYLGGGTAQTANASRGTGSVMLPNPGTDSAMLSQHLGGSGGAFKKRFAAFAEEEDTSDIDEILNEGADDSNNATMSKDDLKKMAAEQKKRAKQMAKDRK